MQTLITFLGKGKNNPQTGYRAATYAIEGRTYKTPFFGLALNEHLKPDNLVILGTSGSMWSVLLDHLSGQQQLQQAFDHLVLELSENEDKSQISQTQLEQITPHLQNVLAKKVELRLIPQGKNDEEQIGILEQIAKTLTDSDSKVHMDITHGFRHLGAIGFLSTAILQRLSNHLSIETLWYGALEMTPPDTQITPVLKLDGLLRVQRWVSALDKFEANGDYSLFSQLLIDDGVDAQKAELLNQAAFYELTNQIPLAQAQLRNFMPELDKPLRGASSLFQAQLIDILNWAKGNNLARQQYQLALKALERNDYLRACILALESIITHRCIEQGLNPAEYEDREKTVRRMNDIEEGESEGFRTLNSLRNALAHGTQPKYHKTKKLLKNTQRFPIELKKILDDLGKELHMKG